MPENQSLSIQEQVPQDVNSTDSASEAATLPEKMNWSNELIGAQSGVQQLITALSKLQDTERRRLASKKLGKNRDKLEIAFCKYREVQQQIGRCLYLLRERASDLNFKPEE